MNAANKFYGLLPPHQATAFFKKVNCQINQSRT